jgi:hypothetical protein
MADQLLETLKIEIEALGTKIRELKESNSSSTEDIGAAVEALKTAKKSYADANNGIGIDGQPYQELLTKAQKKAKAKADKEAAAAAAGAAGAAATPTVTAVAVAEGEDGSKEVGLEKGWCGREETVWNDKKRSVLCVFLTPTTIFICCGLMVRFSFDKSSLRLFLIFSLFCIKKRYRMQPMPPRKKRKRLRKRRPRKHINQVVVVMLRMVLQLLRLQRQRQVHLVPWPRQL